MAKKGLYRKLYTIQTRLDGSITRPETPPGVCEGPLTSG
jgi:hypothetical protein